jgi:hypothetical protein
VTWQTRTAPAHTGERSRASPAAPLPVTPAPATQLIRAVGNRAVQRKEIRPFSFPSQLLGKQDWTTADREGRTQQWKDACLANLMAADSSQYVRVIERKAFYEWFYEYSTSLGYTTRWALAASLVANGAHLIADMDVEHAFADDTLGLASVELQGFMREGNQVIFDNVLPKLRKLIRGGPLTGRAALEWDMQVLAEEQTLIQPMYDRVAPETREQLDYIARKKRFAGIGAWWTDEDEVAKGPGRNPGTVPPFAGSSMLSIRERWEYGMGLGDMFTPGGTGYVPGKDVRPAVGSGYWNGSELAAVDTRAHLHQLDAWLNPNRYTRMGPNSQAAISYLQEIIGKLTPAEKLWVLTDRSADGWAYSTQFAQFGFVTEAMVRQALPAPSTPSTALAVTGFVTRFTAEAASVQARYPDPSLMLPM